ncbi:hypothetical protein [Actinobaculum sp. 352]|uniref:hypothetical protein n=1 Tax=Actinobaculum sp. 352 TaxID=2490946 RepID=UPI000D525AAA|nr:hypothetical protein [Actinobaculum sp. 352]AWE42791.1 hypothetical protein DDD63_08585 [Actinobaculum sp. 313]
MNRHLNVRDLIESIIRTRNSQSEEDYEATAKRQGIIDRFTALLPPLQRQLFADATDELLRTAGANSARRYLAALADLVNRPELTLQALDGQVWRPIS